MKKSQILLILLVLICVIAASALIIMAMKEEKLYDDAERTVQNIVNEAVTGNYHEPEVFNELNEPIYLDSTDPLLREIDWEYLESVSDEILCWIYIPDTYIDFYVMQEPNIGGSKYMWHDINDMWNGVGSIFHPAYEPGVEDAQTIYFGHHMSSRSTQMFSTLLYWADEEYGREHHYLYVYYPDHAERWDLFAVLETDKDDIVYQYPYILGSQTYSRLLQHLVNDSLYNIGPSVTNTDRITTFSTCRDRYAGGPGRFIMSFAPDMTIYYSDIGTNIVVNEIAEDVDDDAEEA